MRTRPKYKTQKQLEKGLQKAIRNAWSIHKKKGKGYEKWKAGMIAWLHRLEEGENSE